MIKKFLDVITGKENALVYSECEHVIANLNKIQFKSLEGIKCGDVMHVILLSSVRNIAFNIVRLLKYMLFSDDIEIKGSGKVALLFSNSYAGRGDHLVKLRKISSLIDDKIEYTPKKRKFCFRLSLSDFLLVWSWIKSISTCVSRKRAVNYAIFLYSAYLDAEKIFDSLQKHKCRSLLVMCDLHPIDCLLVQLAKQHGIVTVTLQHGYYMYDSDDFRYSDSDYFLAFGQADIVNAGRFYDSEKYVRVGMPQFIHSDIPQTMVKNSSRVFLIIMSNYIDEEVAALRETERFISRHPEYKRIIKLHPGISSGEYDYKWLHSDEVITDEYTVYELINQADFAVIPSGSTVFTEYMVMLFPAFLFEKERKAYERLSNREFFKFTNAEELEVLVSKIQSDEMEEQMKIARAYFTETDDIAGKYREFLERLSK